MTSELEKAYNLSGLGYAVAVILETAGFIGLTAGNYEIGAAGIIGGAAVSLGTHRKLKRLREEIYSGEEKTDEPEKEGKEGKLEELAKAPSEKRRIIL